ncbi:hypothetical protein ACP4OV_025292 [Aristida adscensionis]
MAMISAKRLVRMARKWQRTAALARRRLAPSSSTPARETDGGASPSSVAGKGHCVVYSSDGRRFEVPLVCLGTAVFGELLRMAREEFGFAGGDGGRITLPCDAAAMEYAMCLLRRGASEEVERAFLSSMARPCCHGDGLARTMGVTSQQVAVPSF